MKPKNIYRIAKGTSVYMTTDIHRPFEYAVKPPKNTPDYDGGYTSI